MQRIENMPKAKQYIRDNLRRIRKETGLTPYGFAKKYDMHADTIKNIEAGNLPTMLTTFKIFDKLQLEVM